MTTPSPLLATLDELAKRATPGPWYSHKQFAGSAVVHFVSNGAGLFSKPCFGCAVDDGANQFPAGENAEFIAALVTAYPRLRAIIAAADVLWKEADGYLMSIGGRTTDDDLAAAITAYDAARAGDGEKTT